MQAPAENENNPSASLFGDPLAVNNAAPAEQTDPAPAEQTDPAPAEQTNPAQPFQRPSRVVGIHQ
jgi:hypothetical protein